MLSLNNPQVMYGRAIQAVRDVSHEVPEGELSAPVNFANPQQLAGTAVAVYRYEAKTATFKPLTGFEHY